MGRSEHRSGCEGDWTVDLAPVHRTDSGPMGSTASVSRHVPDRPVRLSLDIYGASTLLNHALVQLGQSLCRYTTSTQVTLSAVELLNERVVYVM